MPEVTPVCLDASTAAVVSCLTTAPLFPIASMTLELELEEDVWTEFFHFDTYTFGPFELEEETEVELAGDGAFGDVPVDEEE